jgi:hypothetical protein
MLSIIISSYQKHYFDQLVENIRETIGEDFQYEIIQMWNPNVMSITEAYNSGAGKSRYENLLFLHEDIIFYTRNWGKRLLNHLQRKYRNCRSCRFVICSFCPVKLDGC